MKCTRTRLSQHINEFMYNSRGFLYSVQFLRESFSSGGNVQGRIDAKGLHEAQPVYCIGRDDQVRMA